MALAAGFRGTCALGRLEQPGNSRERTRGMSSFNGYKATKEALATAIGRLTEFFERRGQRPLLLRARDLGDKLAAEQFNLVVLGQFTGGARAVQAWQVNAHQRASGRG